MESLENQDLLLRRAAECVSAKKLLGNVSGQLERVGQTLDYQQQVDRLLVRAAEHLRLHEERYHQFGSATP